MPSCPLKPGLECRATPRLASESRCDCPAIPQCILYDLMDRDRRIGQPIPASEA